MERPTKKLLESRETLVRIHQQIKVYKLFRGGVFPRKKNMRRRLVVKMKEERSKREKCRGEGC